MKTHSAIVDQNFIDLLRDRRVLTEKSGNYAKGWLQLGQKLNVAEGTVIEPYVAQRQGPSFFSMGGFSYSRSNLPFGCVVGRYCSLANGISVMGVGHPMDRLSTAGISYDNPQAIYHLAMQDRGGQFVEPAYDQGSPSVQIGHDVWVGGGVVFKRGVTVGHGAVIAARTVVTKDVPPYAVVAGNPGRVRKMRFDDRLIERLLASRWWDYHMADLREIGTADPVHFLDALEARGEEFAPWTPAPLLLHEVIARA